MKEPWSAVHIITANVRKLSKKDYLCEIIAVFNMSYEAGRISDWVDNRILRGYYTFAKEDVRMQLPGMSDDYPILSPYRLVSRKEIISPWRSLCHNAYETCTEKNHSSCIPYRLLPTSIFAMS